MSIPSLKPLTLNLQWQGVNKHRFGEGLELAEQRWLVSEINNHLESVRGVEVDFAKMPEPDMPESYYNNDRGGMGGPP
jgi:hypothetical protein